MIDVNQENKVIENQPSTTLDDRNELGNYFNTLAYDSNLENEILNVIMGDVISNHDRTLVKTILLTALSAPTNEPINLLLKGDTSTGKTYTVTNVLQLFPRDMVINIGSASAKSWVRDNGTLKDKNGDKLVKPKKPNSKDYKGTDGKEEYKAKMEEYEEKQEEYENKLNDSYIEIDTKGKIIFIAELKEDSLTILKPLLSHDPLDLTYQFTNNNGTVTKVRFNGYPAFIVNSIEKEFGSEIMSRFITATPNSTLDKISDSLTISTNKSSDPVKYSKIEEKIRNTQYFLKSICSIIGQLNLDFITLFTDKIKEEFIGGNPRIMRDYGKFLTLVKVYPLLYICQRPLIEIGGKLRITPTVDDVKNARFIFNDHAESTKTGLNKTSLSYYKTFFKPNDGKKVSELLPLWLKKVKKAERTLQQNIALLSDAGYIWRENLSYNDFKINCVTDADNLDNFQNSDIKLIEFGKKVTAVINEWWSLHEHEITDCKKTYIDGTTFPIIKDIVYDLIVNTPNNNPSQQSPDLSQTEAVEKEPVQPEPETEAPRTVAVESPPEPINLKSSLPDGCYQRIPAGEPCEKCKQHAVEYESLPHGCKRSVKRCQGCFPQFINLFKNMPLQEWRPNDNVH